MYAIIRSAEFYGPRTETQLVAFAATRAIALAHVERCEAAEVAQYGCQVLGHNQASGWSYGVRRVGNRRCDRYGDARYRGHIIPGNLPANSTISTI